MSPLIGPLWVAVYADKGVRVKETGALYGAQSSPEAVMKTLDAPDALDVRTACAQIGLGAKAAYLAAKRGEIPAVVDLPGCLADGDRTSGARAHGRRARGDRR